MKRVTIWKREVLERTGFRKYPFKKVVQYVVEFDSNGYDNGHGVDIDDPKLKIRFDKVFETRSKKELSSFKDNLSKTDADKWLKSIINWIEVQVQ